MEVERREEGGFALVVVGGEGVEPRLVSGEQEVYSEGGTGVGSVERSRLQVEVYTLNTLSPHPLALQACPACIE